MISGPEAPAAGAVLGIDVGFSKKRASTGFCLLAWDAETATLHLARAKTDTPDRIRTLQCVTAGAAADLTVALDGPLTHGLGLVEHYRTAEALLSQGVFQKRGKPGQTSSPTGRRLHQHATALAEMVLAAEAQRQCRLATATHRDPIHERAIVEAFPNIFLAALLPEADLPALKRDASDRFWEACITKARLDDLLERLLPRRRFQVPLSGHENHDDRAAIVCAMTALCVAVGEGVGVGDAVDGDIILPPPGSWGLAADAPEPWMQRALRASLVAVRKRRGWGGRPRVTYRQGEWPDPADLFSTSPRP